MSKSQEERIEKLEERVSELEQEETLLMQTTATTPERWKPKQNEWFYYFDGIGHIHGISNTYLEADLIKFGNCFHTEKEASEALAKIKALLGGE